MASARKISEMTPMTLGGSRDPITRGASTGVGNMKPVTLVATVRIKNSVVMPGMSLALNIPSAARMPLMMAITLMIT